ncbi:phage tail tape measure protein [Streptococcus equi]|uniref:phage tail tape measure protein n=1 Tax=Streptococcus equi TaxID=1336 RepID=UPI0022AC4A94|nr:phage tail tape measure protein [Streptococcus equi]
MFLHTAAADTNAEVGDMAEALKYAGPVAGALGISLEETAAAIGIMSNAGIKGSQAGTTLRTSLSRLTDPTKKMRGIMSELGLEFFDVNGK